MLVTLIFIFFPLYYLRGLGRVAFSFGEVEGPPILPQGAAPQMLGGLTGFIAGLASVFDRTRRTQEKSPFGASNVCSTGYGTER